MAKKFHSFRTKFKFRLKNFVATLNQFGQFVQFVQIVGARVFEVMFSVTTVCLVQGKSHLSFLLEFSSDLSSVRTSKESTTPEVASEASFRFKLLGK